MADAVSTGRIVHFVPSGGGMERQEFFPDQCRAAIVVYVTNDSTVNLAVFDPQGGVHTMIDVDLSEQKEQRTWHWPEREE